MHPELHGNCVLYNEGDKDINIVDIVELFLSFLGNEKWINKKTTLSLKS